MFHKVKSKYTLLKCVTHHSLINETLIVGKSLQYKRNNTLQTCRYMKRHITTSGVSLFLSNSTVCRLLFRMYTIGRDAGEVLFGISRKWLYKAV